MGAFRVAGVGGLMVGLGLIPSVARAAPIEFVEQHEQFMLFDDIEETIRDANFFSRAPFLSAYNDIETGFLAAHDDDSQFIVVYTTWSLPGGIGALFQAVANDTRGIGYEHIAPLDAVIPEPYFDDTPSSQVQGFLHMNLWHQYLGADSAGTDDSTISLYFGQEFGHAWLAFVHADPTLGDPRAMLGRADAHWSFYLHTGSRGGSSPIQGHDWLDHGDGTFTAIKHDAFVFSDLDLYLMGVLPPEDVAPWYVLEDVHDCVDSARGNGDCAPPDAFQFAAESYTVAANRRDITIDDIIAVEGPRVPAYPDAPNTFDASFILIKQPDEFLDLDQLNLMNAIVARSVDLFDDQSRDLAHIVNRTAVGGPPSGGSETDTGPPTSSATDTADPAAEPSTGFASSDSTDGASNPTVDDGTAASSNQTTNGCACNVREDASSRDALIFALIFGPTIRRPRPVTRG